MEETFKKIFEPFKERTKSPFYSAFVVSWLIVNWRIIYFIFTNEMITGGKHKYNYLEEFLQLCSTQGFLNLLFYPLVFTSIYIFIIPIIDLFVFKYSENKRQQRLDKKYEITRKHTVSGDKYVDLLLDFSKQKESLSIIKLQLDEEAKNIESFANENRELKSRAINYESRIDQLGIVNDLYKNRNNLSMWPKLWELIIYDENSIKVFKKIVVDLRSEYMNVPINSSSSKPILNIKWMEFLEYEKKLKFLGQEVVEFQLFGTGCLLLFSFNKEKDGLFIGNVVVLNVSETAYRCVLNSNY